MSAVLNVILRTAIDATGASHGWLLEPIEDRLVVTAAHGDGARDLLSRDIPAGTGTAGFALSAQQPLAMQADGNKGLLEGPAAVLGRHVDSVLAVPALHCGVPVGVIELVDKAGGDNFTFDDVEITTLLAEIVGSVVVSAPRGTPAVPTVSELTSALRQVETQAPDRYLRVAPVIASLLKHG